MNPEVEPLKFKCRVPWMRRNYSPGCFFLACYFYRVYLDSVLLFKKLFLLFMYMSVSVFVYEHACVHACVCMSMDARRGPHIPGTGVRHPI